MRSSSFASSAATERNTMSERRAHRYRVVDVFTEKPLEGNQVPVFPASSDLDPSVVQAIARELNLAEIVFVCPRRAQAARSGYASSTRCTR